MADVLVPNRFAREIHMCLLYILVLYVYLKKICNIYLMQKYCSIDKQFTLCLHRQKFGRTGKL